MMRIRWGLIAAALFVCLARTSLAHALSMIGPPQISSIEWMAADSDLVLRGVVIGVEEVAFRPGSYQKFRLRVDESLTGPRPDEVTVLVHKPAGGEPAPWGDNGAELLVFLVDARRLNYSNIPTNEAPYCLQSVWMPDSALRLDGGSAGATAPNARRYPTPDQVMTMDLRIVSGRDETLRAAAAAVRRLARSREGERATRATISYWHSMPGATSGSLAEIQSEVVVPVCPALEELGRSWVSSPDPKRRFNAAEALAPFRSTENERLLRGLLTDMAWPVEVGESKWRSAVGRAAVRSYHTLRRQWRLSDIPRPAAIPYMPHQPVGFRPGIYAGAIFAGVTLGFLAWRFMRRTLARRGLVPRRGVVGRAVDLGVTLLLFASLAVFALNGRSYRVADEVVRSRGGVRDEAFMRDGTLMVWRLRDADPGDNLMLAYGHFVPDQIGNWPPDETLSHGSFRLDGLTRKQFDADAFLQARSARSTPATVWEAGRFGFRASTHEFRDQFSVRRLDLRLWPIAVVLALPAVARLPALLRRWRRLRSGCCAECGYDLRATTSGRCPECGAATVAAQSARAETV